MTTFVDHSPKGVFRRFDCAVTLGEVADELAHGHQVCVRECSARDVTWLELLTEPYGFDLLLMPASDAPVLEAYLRRRKYSLGHWKPGGGDSRFASATSCSNP
jgi:hypothetical protein